MSFAWVCVLALIIYIIGVKLDKPFYPSEKAYKQSLYCSISIGIFFLIVSIWLTYLGV